MIPDTDATHDPALRSWVESANDGRTDFPIQNLPFGVFKRHGADEDARVGVAIGDCILDIPTCRAAGLFKGETFTAALSCEVATLNPLMALGRDAASQLRRRVCDILRADHPDADTHRRAAQRALVPMAESDMLLPADIGDYTDFYASIHHATNVGGMFRPDNPLLPNYKHLPVAYHGRASSVVSSGTPVRRPSGQTRADGAASPSFGPSGMLDYELEVGFFAGPGNDLGAPIPIESAEAHIFGLCLVNDWSARDIQKWEYQPLGPFLAKSFATTISPWVVTLEALAPYRCPAFVRPDGDPAPLPHLDSPRNREWGGIDVTLEVFLSTARMRESGAPPFRVSRGTLKDTYWTIAQMLAHHTSNGCNVRPADLMATGTVSGPAEESQGCLLERTRRGTQPLALPTGEVRRFLEDGDEVILRGFCERDGHPRIGFGECRGTVVPAV